MPSNSTGSVAAGSVEPAAVGRIWPPTWIWGEKVSPRTKRRRYSDPERRGARLTYLLVARDVEIDGQGRDLGRVLGLPVVPELIPGDVGGPLDVGDHLGLAGVGTGGHAAGEERGRDGEGDGEADHVLLGIPGGRDVENLR